MKKLIYIIPAVFILALTDFISYAGEWRQEGSVWHYYEGDSMLRSSLSPEGYYLDANGNWTAETSILDIKLSARNYFLGADRAGDFEEFKQLAQSLNSKHGKDAESRELFVNSDEFTVYGSANNKKKKLLSLKKDRKTGGYIIRLSTELTRDGYDYQLLRLLVCSISRAGQEVSDAIYSSWEEDNAYRLRLGVWSDIGDSSLKYEAENGAGIYCIKERKAG